MQERPTHARVPDTPAPRLLPDELSTVYCGEDGHLYLASGDGRLTTRLTWSPDDFATLPGLPPVPGVTGELEDSHVFAHPACSADGTRIAAFGLLPTLDEELWEFEGNPWDTLEGEFPYLAEMELDEDDVGLDTGEDDVAGAGMVLVIGEDPEDEEVSVIRRPVEVDRAAVLQVEGRPDLHSVGVDDVDLPAGPELG